VKHVLILTSDDSSAAQENTISLNHNPDYVIENLPTARSHIQLNSVNIISSVILNVNLQIFRPFAEVVNPLRAYGSKSVWISWLFLAPIIVCQTIS
jgi:hypothetical protein